MSKKKPKQMLPSERHAVNEYLSDYEDDLTFEQILKALRNDRNLEDRDRVVWVWEPFEYHPTEWVAEQIEGLERRSRDLNIDNKVSKFAKTLKVSKFAPELFAILKRIVDDNANYKDLTQPLLDAQELIKKITQP